MNMTNDTEQFFEAVWGNDPGMRIIATLPQRGSWNQTMFDTNAEALAFAKDAIRREQNCFFGLHLFDKANRTGKNAAGCRVFYLDIDVGKPGAYQTKEEALIGIDAFVKDTGLKEPVIVDSGNGYHCYWLLDALLSEDDWSASAKRLKALCESQGLKADNVTKDKARVLRVPESINYKDSDEPKKCELVTSITIYPAKDIQAAFESIPARDGNTSINDTFLSGTETEYANDPAGSQEIARLCVPHLSLERCNDYTDWLNIGVALHSVFEGSEEGLALWDEWSKPGDTYKPDSCSRKWESFGGEGRNVGSLIFEAKEDSDAFVAVWESYKADRRIERLAERSKDIQNTDYGNAQRLVALYGHDLRYDPTHKIWWAWDERLWRAGEDVHVMRYAKATAKAMYGEAANTKNDTRRQALAKHAYKSETASSLKAMVELAKSETDIEADISEFDLHPHLLNVGNGVVDLRTGKLLPHSRDMMLSNCTPIEYDPNAKCPVFEGFLSRIFTGNIGLIDYIRRAIGYSLTGETSEHCFFICHGDGANGKSTLLEAIHFLLGDLAATVRTEVLMKHRFTSQSGHNDDVANLHGKRFVAAAETESGHELAASLIKSLTGGDTISASRKYGRGFSFKPQFKIWIAANHKPEIPDTDEGIWRRIRMIPFTERIPENERDLKLAERLRSESQGILAWAVRGSVAWYSGGLGSSPDVDRATLSYRSEQDTVARFIAECCEKGDGFTVLPNLLKESFE